MENEKDKFTNTTTQSAADDASEEENSTELTKEVNQHFPLSGNETDEDLERALKSDDDE